MQVAVIVVGLDEDMAETECGEVLGAWEARVSGRSRRSG